MTLPAVLDHGYVTATLRNLVHNATSPLSNGTLETGPGTLRWVLASWANWGSSANRVEIRDKSTGKNIVDLVLGGSGAVFMPVDARVDTDLELAVTGTPTGTEALNIVYVWTDDSPGRYIDPLGTS